MAYEAYQLGKEAAELLFSRMDGYRGPSRHHVVSTHLVVRGSGEIRPSEVDPLRGLRGRDSGGQPEAGPPSVASSAG